MSIERTRTELVDAIMSMNAGQLAEAIFATQFVFSLPEHQQAEAVKLYTGGMCIADIVKWMAVRA